MCLAIAKPSNTALPSMDSLEMAFSYNSDGAGYSYIGEDKRGKHCYNRKGFMTFAAFSSDITKKAKVIDFTASPMLIHFRIGTHGKKKAPGQTHPFPLCDDYEIMESLRSYSDYSIIHNGIINISDYSKGFEPSDSMAFIRKYMVIMTRFKLWQADARIQNLIEEMTLGSKIAVLGKDGTLSMYGDFMEEDGIYYSNNSYKEAYRFISYPDRTWLYDDVIDDVDKDIYADSWKDTTNDRLVLFANEVSQRVADDSFYYRDKIDTMYHEIVKLGLVAVYNPHTFDLDSGDTVIFNDPKQALYVSKNWETLYEYDALDDVLYTLGTIVKETYTGREGEGAN